MWSKVENLRRTKVALGALQKVKLCPCCTTPIRKRQIDDSVGSFSSPQGTKQMPVILVADDGWVLDRNPVFVDAILGLEDRQLTSPFKTLRQPACPRAYKSRADLCRYCLRIEHPKQENACCEGDSSHLLVRWSTYFFFFSTSSLTRFKRSSKVVGFCCDGLEGTVS